RAQLLDRLAAERSAEVAQEDEGRGARAELVAQRRGGEVQALDRRGEHLRLEHVHRIRVLHGARSTRPTGPWTPARRLASAAMSQPPPSFEETARKGWFARFLDSVERLGNLLPHPVTLFALFALGIVLLSGVAGWFELSVPDPRPEGAKGRSPD